MTRPELSEIREYGTVAGGALGAQSALTNAPTSANKASFLRVVDITTGAVLAVQYANGTTRNLTVAAGREIWADIIGVGAATTVDCIQFGWE